IGQWPAIWSRRGQRLAMGRRFDKKWRKQGPGFVGSHRLTRHAIFLCVTALAVTVADAHRGRSLAQGKLDGPYTVTLKRLPVGQGAWLIDIRAAYFTASASRARARLL